MAVDPNKKRVLIKYDSDDTNSYSLITTAAHAAANGAVSGAGFPRYPTGRTPRHIYGANNDASGQRVRLVIPNPAAGDFVNPVGASFTIAGLGTFDVTGAEGEKRPNGAPPL